MAPEIIFTIGLIIAIFVFLIANIASTDFVLFVALVLLVLTGIITPSEALNGFSNDGVWTIALLFIVSEAIKNTGNLDYYMHRYLGFNRKNNMSYLILKLMAPICFMSAFINNTPIVMIFTPVIKKWAEKVRLPASKFLIPLSYASILGGTCTLIGTSTNLLMHSLMLENAQKGLSLFELAWVGIPCTLIGMLYLAFFGQHLLPARQSARAQVEENPREYVIEMKITEKSILVGKNIREAGLRNLKNVYLLDIERSNVSSGPVSAKEVLQAEDRLIFVGNPTAVVELQEIPGLIPAAHSSLEEDFMKMRTHFIEAVVSSGSPILGKTVKEFDFRKRYGAGIVAVHRHGERIKEKVGSIKLQAGDTLLLLADESFTDRWKDSQDFFLISYIKDILPTSPGKSAITLTLTGLMVLFAALGEYFPKFGLPEITILHTAAIASILLLVLKCIDGRGVKKSMRWDVLFVITFALGISKGIQSSGTADLVAESIRQAAGHLSPAGILILLYVITVFITEILSNNAAVALVFPIAFATAQSLGLDPKPFLIAITIAASNGFASPLGYQTHLIVQGPGSYRFSDFLKVGLPMDLIVGITAISAILFHWKF